MEIFEGKIWVRLNQGCEVLEDTIIGHGVVVPAAWHEDIGHRATGNQGLAGGVVRTAAAGVEQLNFDVREGLAVVGNGSLIGVDVRWAAPHKHGELPGRRCILRNC